MNAAVYAIFEIGLLGILSGIVGTLAVLRGRVFATVALSHATFPGGVIAALLGANVLVGSALFSVVLVLLLTVLGRVRRQGQQVASGVVLTFGFAFGVLLQSLNPQVNVPVDALLIGSLLSVNSVDIAASAGVTVFAAIALLLFGRALLFSTFDPSGARAAGFTPAIADAVTLSLIAATVVVAMPAVGAILGVSLIIGPAVIARLLVTDVRALVPVSVAVALLAGALGLTASYTLSVAAGGAVGLAVTMLYLVAVVANRFLRHSVKQRRPDASSAAQHLAA